VNERSVPLASSAPRDAHSFGRDFTTAFQPIVDVNAKTILGYEALVRGRNNATAAEIIAKIEDADRAGFDHAFADAAVDLALKLNLATMLSLNVDANLSTLPVPGSFLASETVGTRGLPASRLMLEVSQSAERRDRARMRDLFAAYRQGGVATAIDKFGAGSAGLDLLADFQPGTVKLSMALVRGIDRSPLQRAIVAGIAQVCSEIGIRVVAVGVETVAECCALRDIGLRFFQGNLFLRPALESLPEIPAALWDNLGPRHPQGSRPGKVVGFKALFGFSSRRKAN
jgi:EAL domain-containing protein (putative c-di-GMP-specific phosphodiesterase class I)